MIGKRIQSAAEAMHVLRDGATGLVGGFGGSGLPRDLVAALAHRGSRDLTVGSNHQIRDRRARTRAR